MANKVRSISRAEIGRTERDLTEKADWFMENKDSRAGEE